MSVNQDLGQLLAMAVGLTDHNWGSQRDVVCLGGPIAPSYMSPTAGGGGVGGSQPMSTAVEISLHI